MIINHDRGFVFFSAPKTGSESIRALLAPYNQEQIRPWAKTTRDHPFYPHMPPRDAEVCFSAKGWDFSSYQRISCVRNPYARLVSLYRMIVEVDRGWRIRTRFGLRPSFAQWLKAVRPDGRGGGGRNHQRWRRYGAWSAQAWLHNHDECLLVDHVLRLEDINIALPRLLAKLSLSSVPLLRLNSRPEIDVGDWYNSENRALVGRLYQWDIKHFNYSFAFNPTSNMAINRAVTTGHQTLNHFQ